MGDFFDNGTDVGFNRMHFQGKDWSSMSINMGSHYEIIVMEHRGEKVPLTINVCVPPAVKLVAGGGFIHSMVPVGTDELGIAGGIQGFPVEIVKARTVDAYAIAQAEWVIEGYVDTTQKVWESDECEKMGDNVAPFFPEYTGYMGRARRTYKFQVTAITHRKDRPIFYTPLAHSFEGNNICNPLREALLYEIADRICPGLVIDINTLQGQKAAGVVFQVKKRRKRDEGYQKNIISSALSAQQGIRMVVVADEDIDIYNAEDVIWAITTRLDPNTGLIRGGGARGIDNFPIEKGGSPAQAVYEGGIGFDVTVPMDLKWRFKVGKYAVDRVDLRKWFSEEEITNIQAQQNEYARLLAKRGQ